MLRCELAVPRLNEALIADRFLFVLWVKMNRLVDRESWSRKRDGVGLESSQAVLLFRAFVLTGLSGTAVSVVGLGALA
jgi:hypothetical protein